MKKFDFNKIQLEIPFYETLRDYSQWIRKAEDLLDAAKLLEAEITQYWSEVHTDKGQVISEPKRKNVQDSYLLLTAYALENYFKAILIHKNQKELQSARLSKIPDYLIDHELVQLAQKISMKLTFDEEELLTRLSRLSIWAARYPVPVGPNHISAMKQFSDGKNHFFAFITPKDIELVKDFIKRLQELLLRLNL